jgi:AcrR family transcriptional regulator
MAEVAGSRQRILEVAARLFRRRGFEGTGMREIAAGAGLAKSSLYNHFSSKQAMLFEIVQKTVERTTPALRAIAEAELPAAERLREAVAAHVVELIHDLDNVACFVEEGRFLEPAYLSAHLASRDEYERSFRQILATGVESGEFRLVELELTSLALLGMCNWVARWYRPDGRLDAAQIGAEFGELAVRAVAADCAASRIQREEERG